MSTKPLFKKVDSGDYINYKKRTAIAGEYAKANPANINPVKMNGKQYNKNFTFIPTLNTPTTDISNCLIYAQSYALKQDYTFGANYLYKVCDASGN
jgi:hypothetical protein